MLSWTAILVYLLLSSRYTRERKQQRPCREVRVVVLDSAERGFITPAMVRGWFASEKIPLVGRELSVDQYARTGAFRPAEGVCPFGPRLCVDRRRPDDRDRPAEARYAVQYRRRI